MSAENERQIVLEILTEVLEEKRFFHLVLHQALEKYAYLPENKRAFISRLSRLTVERLLTLDAALSQVSSVPPARMKPVIRNILRMTACQIFWFDVPGYAAVSEAVKLTRIKGFAGLTGFVNAVSRAVLRKKDSFDFSGSDEARYSMPEDLIRRIRTWYPAEADAFFQAQLSARQGTTIRIFRRSDLSRTLDLLSEDGCTVRKAAYADRCFDVSGDLPIGEWRASREGLFEVMDAASALVVQCAAPEKNSLCLDLCGAPGGKSIGLADWMEGSGLVECRDLSETRLSVAEENAAQAGFTNLKFAASDAAQARPEDAERYDLVLADLPCSGLGVLGRKPDLKYRITGKDLSALADLQRRMLDTAMCAVKKGGVLIYSTCTINPGENGKNADFILRSGDFQPESLRPYLGEVPEGCDPDTGRMQLLPGRNRCDGFFIARFRKSR